MKPDRRIFCLNDFTLAAEVLSPFIFFLEFLALPIFFLPCRQSETRLWSG
jgi:hypothetical protein